MLRLSKNSPQILAMLTLLTVATLSVTGQQRRSSISGFVFDPDRRPLSQINVELANEYNSVIGRVRTTGSGRYFFSGLPHGRYTVRALPLGTGFDEQSVEVEIAGIGAAGQLLADNIQKDIYLRLRKTNDVSPFRKSVVFAQEVPPEAETLFKDGAAELERKQVEAGAEKIEQALKVFPTYYDALHRLGIVRLVQERFSDAIELFSKALQVNERSFDCWYGLARASYSARKFSEAAVAAEKATVNRPESVEAHLLFGMSLRTLKEFSRAEKALKQAEKLAGSTAPDVHWQLALLYGKDQERFSDAAKQLEQFLVLSPDAPNKEDIKRLIKQFQDKARKGS